MIDGNALVTVFCGHAHELNTRRFIGILLMIAGPVLVLGSPWLVLSFGLIHGWVCDEGWALMSDGRCIWFSEPKESAVISCFSALVVFGVLGLFAGLWLFRSARIRRTGGHNHSA